MANPMVTVSLGNAQHTVSLHRWLVRDQRLRGYGEVSLVHSGKDVAENHEQLGDPTALIGIILSTALALPEFLASLQRWRSQLAHDDPRITIRGGGVVIEVSQATTLAQLTALTTALENAEGLLQERESGSEEAH